MKEKIKKIYDEVYNLFPKDEGKKELLYVRRNWIFPHHIDIMLNLAEELCVNYKGDIDICKLAIILHDAGLVFERTESSSINHEERSIKYSLMILKKFKLTQNVINQVVDCVKATQLKNKPKIVNEKIVRTVDALSQYISIHFIAKALFAKDFDAYLLWLDKKINENYGKICFEDERKIIEPIRNYYLNALKLYKKHK